MKTQDNRYNSEDTKELLNPTFTEASSRTNINSGDSHKIIFGKIKKWFADLKAVAFSGAYSDLNGTPNLATVATSGKYSDLSGTPNLSTVATSGKYSDLSGKPTIPTNNNQLTNGAGYITSSGSCNYANSAGSAPASDVYSWAKASSKPSYSWNEITSKPNFATVATSGSYNDLSGKPTIPTDNSQIGNGAGYITSSGTAGNISNAQYYTWGDGIRPKSDGTASTWGVINKAGNLYAFYTEYETGNTTVRGNLTVNGTITAGGIIGTNGTVINIYGCEFNVTPKNGYPYFRNTDGENFCMVVGDNNHRYKLSWADTHMKLLMDNSHVANFVTHMTKDHFVRFNWNGSELEVYVDNTKVGAMTLH